MRHTFFGGVCPASHKNLTQKKPISPLDEIPELVTIPLRASADEMAVPLVQPGDHVQVGQPIAQVEKSGLTLHASLSGEVEDVKDCPHPWGGLCPALVIRSDGQETPWPDRPDALTPEQVNLSTLLERVNEAGIVGMGGDSRSIANKLRKAEGKITYIIVNAAECEPYVTADHRLLLEHADQLLLCTQVLSRCLRATRVAVVTQGDKLNAAEMIERRVQLHSGTTKVYTLRTRYPLGSEKQIIQTVTGQELKHGASPLEAGCLVLNVATVYAISQALFDGKALTHRAVTVSGGAITRPRNLWVPIGTPLSTLLKECGQLKDGAAQLLTGGVMMGRPVEDLNTPICKDTNCFIALSDAERKDGVETTCIRCGKCAASCPMHLVPTFIAQALRQGDMAQLKKLHVEDCLSCGCCSFVCPANIPLVELVHQAGEEIEKGGVQ